MEIFGYLSALFIGISLGLIGGGGSILTIPVLVYLFGINPVLATSYSLFIVGATSFFGAVSNFRNHLVSVKTGLLFGSVSISTVFLTRKILIPVIPEQIFSVRDIVISQSILTMVLFAILMLIASLAMIRSTKDQKACVNVMDKKTSLPRLLLYGLLVGLATGMLGAGGGFLIIPTLVLLVGLPMKNAIGTSLFIITLNSLIGFTGDLGHFAIDWKFLLPITALAIAGMFIGVQLGRKINGEKLKKGFGWFVMIMGTYIIIKELFSL